jgi:adenosylcobinamide-GDP ribazoletransferase
VLSVRGFFVAAQLLTRIPVPKVGEYSGRELAGSAWWFPVVGVCVGAVVAGVVWIGGYQSPLVAAALGVLAWSWITGAMHLDGLADLADALGASHRDPQKFLQVLADPHVGSFGVVSIGLALILKVAFITELPAGTLPALALIPAWARLGSLVWSRSLPPLKGGRAQQLAEELARAPIIVWMVALAVLSALTAPVLLIAPLAIYAWTTWLRVRLGGVSGDCLGAGIELVEIVLLGALMLGGHFTLARL